REYIRRLVRDRLRTALVLTISQLGLLAGTAFSVRCLGEPLAGRLLGSALVWFLIAFNLNRFLSETVPEIAEARRHLAGPLGHVRPAGRRARPAGVTGVRRWRRTARRNRTRRSAGRR